MKKKLVAIAAAAPPALGGMGYTATQLGNKQSPAEKNAEALGDEYPVCVGKTRKCYHETEVGTFIYPKSHNPVFQDDIR